MNELESSCASSIERQFWLLQHLLPESSAYHIGSVFQIRGALDIAALQGAFEDLQAHHPILRSTFFDDDGRLSRRVHRSGTLDFRVSEARVDPEGEEVASELHRPFDLEHGPLMRIHLWRAAPEAYVMAWTMHHVITDLASKTLLANELSERYALRRAGGCDRAAAPQGTDACARFAEWERAWSETDAARNAETFFTQLLQPLPPPLALPEDLPRPALQSPRGARIPFSLGIETSRRLARAATEWQTKPFLILLTTYAVLLARLSGEKRFTIGVPFPNRRREESQTAIGCFVNILPVPVDLTEDPPFLDLLRLIRTTFLGLHRHQELSIERIVACSKPARDTSRNPIFQTGFTFEPPMALSLEGCELTSFKAHGGGSQLDLFLTLWPTPHGFCGQLEYCTDLFHHATVERWTHGFSSLLERVLEPEAAISPPVSRLDVLPPGEREQVVHAWNRTEAVYDAPSRLDALFLRQAARTPEAPALRMGDRCWTYRQFADRALALAHALRARGVGVGDRVGLFMERSFEMVTAIYATILAGAAYVPLDPDYPEQRLRFMIEDAQPHCVLTHGDLGARWPLPESATWTLRLEDLGPRPDSELAALSPEHTAYVIFTSGSTGRPKGVANSHRGITNRLLWMQEAFQLRPSDVVLQKTPFSFDVSVWEFFWPLCAGAQLEIAPPGAHRDPGALVRLIQQAEVTTLHFVPSMLHVFLEHPEVTACRSIRRIVCSGEALSGDLVRRCCQLLPAELDNLYGPTEAAVDVTWWRCRSDLNREPVPIGRPIANTQLYVLDPHGQPLPINVPGELFIGGVQVAQGYVHRPELTAERFVPDPFCDDASAAYSPRLYRTGDRARWNADGTIDFLGRLDHQVKIHGLRIELGEIESVLDQHPSVGQSVVIARALDAGDCQLVAYVQPIEGRTPEASLSASLREHVASKLPAYMVPPHIVVMERLPLNSNGKIDRKALPAPGPRTDERPTSVPPRNELETWLVAQCQALLGGARIGIRDNLFEAGCTSLTAAQLIGRIRVRVGTEVPLVRLFEHPTIEALAACLAQETSAATDQTTDPLAKTRARAERQRSARPRHG